MRKNRSTQRSYLLLLRGWPSNWFGVPQYGQRTDGEFKDKMAKVVCGPRSGQLGAFGLFTQGLFMNRRIMQMRQPIFEAQSNQQNQTKNRMLGITKSMFVLFSKLTTASGMVARVRTKMMRVAMCRMAVKRNNSGLRCLGPRVRRFSVGSALGAAR